MSPSGPLSGITILDFTHVLAGPFGTMLLGDLGAEVIKVEPPGIGDSTRANGPPFQNGESAFFFCVNRNKKSIGLDLKSEKGRAIIKKLVAECDVLVENFRPGTMDRLGLGYADISKLKPDIIYASLNAFGSTGPYRNRPGFELIIQGLTGLVDITSQPGQEPAKIQIQIVDLCGGMVLALSIMAALFHRERTGKGQQTECSLLQSTMAIMANYVGIYLMSGTTPNGLGTRNAQAVPSQAFKTKDAYVLVVSHGRLWTRFCKALARPEWIDDERMRSDAYRIENRQKVEEMIEAVTVQKTTAEWLEIFAHHDVAAGPINTLAELFDDPQVVQQELVVSMEQPKAGNIKLLASPFHFSETRADVRRPPPAYGQHCTEILKMAGYSDPEIKKLKKEKVVNGN
jgi:crotonobetainyl-CoA:carnitine CoA-transferase CaiB-like acyl-CoA transferase